MYYIVRFLNSSHEVPKGLVGMPQKRSTCIDHFSSSIISSKSATRSKLPASWPWGPRSAANRLCSPSQSSQGEIENLVGSKLAPADEVHAHSIVSKSLCSCDHLVQSHHDVAEWFKTWVGLKRFTRWASVLIQHFHFSITRQLLPRAESDDLMVRKQSHVTNSP